MASEKEYGRKRVSISNIKEESDLKLPLYKIGRLR